MHPDAINFSRDELMFNELVNIIHKIHFVLTSNPDKLQAVHPVATVEAEYGDRVVEGEVLTLAHHGPRKMNVSPCMTFVVSGTADAIVQDQYVSRTVGLSHTDLDSIGGILRIVESHTSLKSWRLGSDAFWKLAEFVDLNGSHVLADYEVDDLAIQQLWAWWAWERDNACIPTNKIKDINDWILRAITALAQIFFIFGDPPATQRLNAGKKFREKEDELSQDSFLSMSSAGCAVRVSPEFVNHLYSTPQGPAKVIVGYNTKTGMITVSKHSPSLLLNVQEVVRHLWGSEAGGHEGIAGSPRNRRMSLYDLAECLSLVNLRLKRNSQSSSSRD